MGTTNEVGLWTGSSDGGIGSRVGRVISSPVLMVDHPASVQSLQRRSEHMKMLLARVADVN